MEFIMYLIEALLPHRSFAVIATTLLLASVFPFPGIGDFVVLYWKLAVQTLLFIKIWNDGFEQENATYISTK